MATMTAASFAVGSLMGKTLAAATHLGKRVALGVSVGYVPDMATVQSIADHLLGRPVADFIAERRAAGRNWREVRDDIQAATSGVVNVTRQAVQLWAAEDTQHVA